MDEARRDRAALLLEALDAPAEFDAARTQPLLGRAIQDHLQLAAMDRELRPRQAGMPAARVGPDRLAVAVCVDQLAGFGCVRRHRRGPTDGAEGSGGARLAG